MSDAQPKNPGTVVIMDGREWTVPALSVMDFRRNAATLMQAPKADDVEALGQHIEDVLPVLYLAFKRNYPDVQEKTFIDMVDMRSYAELTSAVLAASGVTKGKPGEV